MLALALAALLSVADQPTAPPLDVQPPPQPDVTASEVEGVTVTARLLDPDAPRPEPIKHVSIAPEGDRVAYVAEGPAGERVVVQHLDGTVQAVVETGPLQVRGAEWADANHVVMHLSRGERGRPQAVSYDLRDRSFAVFFDRTPSTTSSPFQPPLRGRPNETLVKALLSSPVTGVREGEPVSFVRGATILGKDMRFDLYRVNLDSGLSKVHAEGNHFTGDFVVAPDGRVLARSDYNRRTGRWRLLARKGPGWREVLARKGQTRRPEMLGLGRDENSVLVRFADSATPRLVEISMPEGVSSPLNADRTYGDTLFDRNDGRLIAMTYKGPEPEYVMFEPRLRRAWPDVVEAFDGQTVTLESWTPDYAKLVVLAEGPADPAAYHLVDLDANTARRLRPALRDRPDATRP